MHRMDYSLQLETTLAVFLCHTFYFRLKKESMESEPGNTQAFNRYSFVCGSPIAFQDEGGYFAIVGIIIAIVIVSIFVASPSVRASAARTFENAAEMVGGVFDKAVENFHKSFEEFSKGNIGQGVKHFGLGLLWGVGGYAMMLVMIVLIVIAIPWIAVSGLWEAAAWATDGTNSDLKKADDDLDKADPEAPNGDNNKAKWPKWVKALHKTFEIAFYFSVILCITMVIVIICLPGGFVGLGLLAVMLKIAVGSVVVAGYTGTSIFGKGARPFDGGATPEMRIGRYHYTTSSSGQERVHKDRDDAGIYFIGTIAHVRDSI